MARVLYWLLHGLSFSKRHMSQLYEEVDPTTQKHIQSEQKRSPELTTLSNLPRRLLQTIEAELTSEPSALVANQPMKSVPTTVSSGSSSSQLSIDTRSNSSSTTSGSVVSTQPSYNECHIDPLEQDNFDTDALSSRRSIIGGSKRMSLTGPVRIMQPTSTATTTSSHTVGSSSLSM
jgi:hypothetical protein